MKLKTAEQLAEINEKKTSHWEEMKSIVIDGNPRLRALGDEDLADVLYRFLEQEGRRNRNKE